MYELAADARPRHATRRWRRRRSPRWCSPATRASASSTTSTTAAAACRTPTPTRSARGSSPAAGRPASGSRCSTPATSTAGSARRSTTVQARFSDGIARAVGRPGRRARTVATDRADRCGDPLGARRRPGVRCGVVAAWAAEQRRRLHAHVSEQPEENDECLAAYGSRRSSVLDEAGALSDRFTAVHATHVDGRRHRDARQRAGRAAASARRPNASSPTASVRPRRSRAAGVELCVGSDSHAVIDPFEETRAVELDERLASLRRGDPPAGGPARPRRRRPATRASAGRTAARSRVGAPADFVTVVLRQPAPRRIAIACAIRSPPSCSPPRRPTSATSSSAASVVVRDGVHQRRRRHRRARALDRRRLGGRSMTPTRS